MGWLIALGVLVLLALFPIGLGVSYREETLELRVRAAFLSFRLPLQKLLDKLTQKKEPEKKEPEAKPRGTPPPKTEKMKLGDLMPLIRLGIRFLGDLRRKLRVDRLECNLILASEDPCDLAVLYGSAWAAAGNIQAQLERYFVIRKRDIRIQCDFTGEKTLFSGRLDLHITLGRIVSLLVCYGVRAIRELLNLKKRKGGALL